MNGRQRDRIKTLKRRQSRLSERLRGYQGDPHRTRAELAALTWAIGILEAADEQGVLQELEEEGARVRL